MQKHKITTFFFFTNNKKGQYKLHNIEAVNKTSKNYRLHKYSNCGSIGQALSQLTNAGVTIT